METKPLNTFERQCLRQLFVSGASNKEIGTALGRSEQVVKNALFSAYRKLGITGSRGLFPLVIRAGAEMRGISA